MWKIRRLYLKNFKHIKSGLGREEITLDLSINDKSLNIFVGKMGTGKSAILGHLQPFSNYGTLDIRNQDDLILPEVDGCKEIDYEHNTHLIEIRHLYTWNRHSASHNTRSYFRLDGEELNPTGNVGLFRGLVSAHFGIDQSFLRILRLGPNVANVINMKAAERKAFIATLIQNTEIYRDLYTKMNDDLRKINATIAVLSKKLVSISSTEEDSMKKELEDLRDRLLTTEEEQDQAKNAFFRLRGILVSIYREYGQREDMNPDAFMDYFRKYIMDQNADLEATEELIAEKESLIESVDSSIPLVEYVRQIGAKEAHLNHLKENALVLDKQYHDVSAEIAKCDERLAMRGSASHLQDLKQTADLIREKFNEATKQLKGFTPSFSYRYLADFTDSLSILKMEINEVASYNSAAIARAYYSDNSLAREVARTIDHMTGRIVNLKKQLANIEYAATYQQYAPMIRPPMCPTKDCIYYCTHPVTIKEGLEIKRKREEAVQKLKNEIDDLQVKIGSLEELPILKEKIEHLKSKWKDVQTVLSKCAVETKNNLFVILSDAGSRMSWYNASQLQMVLEKHKIQEDYYTLESRLKSVMSEIQLIEGDEDISGKRDALAKEADGILQKIEENDRMLHGDEHELEDLKQKATIVEEMESTKADIQALRNTADKIRGILSNAYQRMGEATDARDQMVEYQRRIADCEKLLSQYRSRSEILRGRLSDIAFAKKEFAEVSKQKEEIRDIMDAVSTKGGIPLIMVQAFLNGSLDILNDLIADVFADDLEILRFDISENEFKIPYAVGGLEIDDIDTASQGQQAVISIALSFALVRQSMFDYNIMLLDEVDGALYRKDREKFLSILFKQLEAIDANQVFLISHNTTFDNTPANIILTSEEDLDSNPIHTVIPLY